jgi:hypothetical protein
MLRRFGETQCLHLQDDWTGSCGCCRNAVYLPTPINCLETILYPLPQTALYHRHMFSSVWLLQPREQFNSPLKLTQCSSETSTHSTTARCKTHVTRIIWTSLRVMSAETFQAATFSLINRMNVAIKPYKWLFIAHRLSNVKAKTSNACKQILAFDVISSLGLKVCTLLILCRFVNKWHASRQSPNTRCEILRGISC